MCLLLFIRIRARCLALLLEGRPRALLNPFQTRVDMSYVANIFVNLLFVVWQVERIFWPGPCDLISVPVLPIMHVSSKVLISGR